MEHNLIIETGLLNIFISSCIVLGLSAATISDQWQLLKKVQGSIKSQVAGGYNSAMKIMVFNRFGAVIFFSSSAFYIESSGSFDGLLKIYFIAITLIIIALILVVVRYLKHQILAVDFLSNHKLAIASFLANKFGILGLTIPLLAGILFLEYRLLLSNSSFLFNTIYTMIMVFYLESKLAKLIDESSENIKAAAFNIIIGRVLAYIFVWILFLIGILYVQI